jgi:hypothetical protein
VIRVSIASMVSGVMEMAVLRRPRDLVASVLVHNEVDDEGRWIAMKLEKESWVNLRASR